MFESEEDVPTRPRSNRAPLIAAGIVVVLLIGAGWLVLRQLSALSDGIGDLSRRVSELAEDVSEAESRTAIAEREADTAEKETAAALALVEISRQQAAQSQDQARAEAAVREVAERDRELAEQEADLALAQAEETREELEEVVEDLEGAEEAAEAAHADARRTRAEAAEIRRQRELELDRLQQTLDRIVETRRTALGMVMNLGSDRVEFDFDKAALRPENRELLSRIVGVLLTAGNYQLQVFGHTDDVGSAAYNQKLSERRAQAVRDYLVEACLDPTIVTARGFGKEKPLAEGTDAESRQHNRRVEIGLIQTDIDYTPVPETTTNQLNSNLTDQL